jgi:hypothetical protein
MSIYVDRPVWYNKAPIIGYWCHCSTDNIDNLEELHTFIKSIGLQRKWFQLKNGTFPHYDLYEGKSIGRGKFSQAMKNGAILTTSYTEIARKCWLDKTGKPYIFTSRARVKEGSTDR